MRAYHRHIRGLSLSVIVENEGGGTEEKKTIGTKRPRLDLSSPREEITKAD